jgi:hypothetical protein
MSVRFAFHSRISHLLGVRGLAYRESSGNRPPSFVIRNPISVLDEGLEDGRRYVDGQDLQTALDGQFESCRSLKGYKTNTFSSSGFWLEGLSYLDP